MKRNNQKNILGGELILCSSDPITGFTRNGCCDSHKSDFGKHLLCARVDDKFLQFQLSKGNDLITPKPEFNFKGLVSGDKWCVCVSRWLEAYRFSCAPPIILQSSHIDVLEKIDLEILKRFAIDLN